MKKRNLEDLKRKIQFLTSKQSKKNKKVKIQENSAVITEQDVIQSGLFDCSRPKVTFQQEATEFIHLDIKQFRKWNKQQTCSLLCDKTIGASLTIQDVKPLYDAQFDGESMGGIVDSLNNGIAFAYGKFNSSRKYQHIRQTILDCVVDWVWDKFITYSSILRNIPLLSFSIITCIQPKLDTLPDELRTALNEWSKRIDETIQEQKESLGCLYRTPLLPDHYGGFTTKIEWTNHFNNLRIPEDKGKELIDLLSNESLEGRGTELGHCVIALVDLSTSGKTYTVFQLANAQSSSDRFTSFFVINLVTGTVLFDEFLEQIYKKKHSPEHVVSLLALTINICVSTLIDKVPSITPLDFLKFTRHSGDLILSNIFSELVKFYNEQDNLSHLNIDITKKLTEKRVKIVFSFDEARLLLHHAKNMVLVDGEQKGSLFHAVYQEIRIFNNPVFLSNSFRIIDEILVSKEGRNMVRPVIGSLQPWLLPQVDQALTHLFNIDDVKQKHRGEYDILCYLLSGSPEYVARLHRRLITLRKPNSLTHPKAGMKSKIEVLKEALHTVIKYKEERARCRLKEYMQETRLMDRKTHLFRLFNQECIFQQQEIMELDKSNYPPYTYSKAFIEGTLAHVVTNSNGFQIFDIVNPIVAKTLFEFSFETMVEDLWQFMSDIFIGKDEEFKLFMIILLLHESKLLNRKSFTQSPLFKSYANLGDQWCLNTKSLLNDSNLSKKMLKNHSGIWLSQLAHNYFINSFVRSHDEMGPDGLFYLQHCHNKKYQLITCVMTLISDPINEKENPDRIINQLKTLCLNNIGKEKSGKANKLNYTLPSNLSTNTNTLGWIVAPNMDATTFSVKKLATNLTQTSDVVIDSLKNGQLKLIVTDRQAIDECLSQYQSEKFYPNMQIVWKKFK